MGFGDRLLFFFTAVVPPLVVVLAAAGAAAWAGLTDFGHHPLAHLTRAHVVHQALGPLVFGGGIALFVAWLWLIPALRDFLSGRMIVAEGPLVMDVHVNTTGEGNTYKHYYCGVIDHDDIVGHEASVGRIRAWLLGRHERERVRLYIAPASKRLVHWRLLGPAPAVDARPEAGE